MTTYSLEIRSTAEWNDIRYRDYTTNARKAEAFKAIPKIDFTDSGHGLIPVVKELDGPRRPKIAILADHVSEHLRVPARTSRKAEALKQLHSEMATAVRDITDLQTSNLLRRWIAIANEASA